MTPKSSMKLSIYFYYAEAIDEATGETERICRIHASSGASPSHAGQSHWVHR